jgi:hypothetical protein
LLPNISEAPAWTASLGNPRPLSRKFPSASFQNAQVFRNYYLSAYFVKYFLEKYFLFFVFSALGFTPFLPHFLVHHTRRRALFKESSLKFLPAGHPCPPANL